MVRCTRRTQVPPRQNGHILQNGIGRPTHREHPQRRHQKGSRQGPHADSIMQAADIQELAAHRGQAHRQANMGSHSRIMVDREYKIHMDVHMGMGR